METAAAKDRSHAAVESAKTEGYDSREGAVMSAASLGVADASVDGLPSAPLAAVDPLHTAPHGTTTFTSLLGERKRGSDSEVQEEVEDDEEVVEEDTARLISMPVDEVAGTLVQCPPLEQSFESWDDFHRAMEEYCVATHQPMRLRTSDSAKAVNSRAAKRNSLKEPIDERVGFVKKLYLCTHGVKTKPRGKGKRPRQHYRYMGCPAMIRACISESSGVDEEGKSKYIVRVVAQVSERKNVRAYPGGSASTDCVLPLRSTSTTTG